MLQWKGHDGQAECRRAVTEYLNGHSLQDLLALISEICHEKGSYEEEKGLSDGPSSWHEDGSEAYYVSQRVNN